MIADVQPEHFFFKLQLDRFVVFIFWNRNVEIEGRIRIGVDGIEETHDSLIGFGPT